MLSHGHTCTKVQQLSSQDIDRLKHSCVVWFTEAFEMMNCCITAVKRYVMFK